MNCPLNCLTCSVCCQKGHTLETCPNGDALQHRDVEFVEQLILPSLRKAYGIKTATPLPKRKEPPRRFAPVLEVLEEDSAIRAILRANGIEPSNKMKDNKVKLTKVAEELGRSLYYIPVK